MKKAVLAVAVAFAFAAFAQEHPEHPKSKEHPQSKQAHAYSIDELEKAIVAEIDAVQKKNDGSYPLEDKEASKTWKLVLDHVHRERLSKLDAKTYFACTDFKSEDGKVVDVDFFMKDDGKTLVMTETTIHKIDGKPRYNWKEKEGYWERVPVE
jgi:hypothetical protein